MTETPEKMRRHRAIRTLLHEESVTSQQDLVRLLARRGFDVTQATLSRDLKELRVVRMPDGEGYRYHEASEAASAGDVDAAGEGPAARRLRSVAALEVTGIDSNETCVIVRTLTGRAQGVAVWVDGLGLGELLATIAGDDTILVVPRSIKKTARLKARLQSALGL